MLGTQAQGMALAWEIYVRTNGRSPCRLIRWYRTTYGDGSM